MRRIPRNGSSRRADAQRPDEEAPLGTLGGLAQLLGGESDRSRRFLGGIAAGALAGAAMAGAALMRRRSPGRRKKG